MFFQSTLYSSMPSAVVMSAVSVVGGLARLCGSSSFDVYATPLPSSVSFQYSFVSKVGCTPSSAKRHDPPSAEIVVVGACQPVA